MDNHILITGIPGTGKTAVGEYLRQHHGFSHLDFEDGATLATFSQDKDGFIANALKQKKAVITWGFMPYHQAKHVIKIKKMGFSLIWFDGNRIAAFREFMKRGTVSEAAFFHQMSNITSSNVIDVIQPKIVNPFDKDGKFRALDQITKEVLGILTQ